MIKTEKKSSNPFKEFFDKHAFKNANTYYPFPIFRFSYGYLEPTYLDVMWLNYGLQFEMPFTVKTDR